MVDDALHHELQALLADCDVIGIGEETQALIDKLNHGQYFSDPSAFKQYLEDADLSDQGLMLSGPWSDDMATLRTLLEEQSHETTVTVNLQAISDNLNTYRDLLAPATALMVMVKAFAYGTGDSEIAHILEHQHTDRLGVAYCDEGVHLRLSGIILPIMVLNCAEHEFQTMADYDLEPEVYSLEMLQSLADFATYKPIDKVAIHLKVDTGMHRLGLAPGEVAEALELISSTDSLQLCSVLSHLYASDSEDRRQVDAQFEKFDLVRAEVLRSSIPTPLFHILNSTGISRFPEQQLDMVRLGIGLYGYSGDKALCSRLRPVISWHTAVSQVKIVAQGETVSYGGKFLLERDTRIAILPVGYADGLSRTLGHGRGRVYIEGKACPFVGSICMDMSMVDIGDLPCSRGTRVSIIGAEQSIEVLAADMNTIPYEVLTSIPPRVKRSYVFAG